VFLLPTKKADLHLSWTGLVATRCTGVAVQSEVPIFVGGNSQNVWPAERPVEVTWSYHFLVINASFCLDTSKMEFSFSYIFGAWDFDLAFFWFGARWRKIHRTCPSTTEIFHAKLVVATWEPFSPAIMPFEHPRTNNCRLPERGQDPSGGNRLRMRAQHRRFSWFESLMFFFGNCKFWLVWLNGLKANMFVPRRFNQDLEVWQHHFISDFCYYEKINFHEHWFLFGLDLA